MRAALLRERQVEVVEQLARVAGGLSGTPAAQRNVRRAIIAGQVRALDARARTEAPDLPKSTRRALVERQLQEFVLPELGFTRDGELAVPGA